MSIFFAHSSVSEAQTVLGMMKMKSTSGLINLRVVTVEDAIAAGNGVVKIRLTDGITGAADLVNTDHAAASPVRIMTPYGIRSWRKENMYAYTFGGTSSDYFYSMDKTSEGGFVMAGLSSSWFSSGNQFLVKTTGTGSIVFGAVYGTTTETQNCQAVIERTEGGYLLGGNSFVAYIMYEYQVFTDASGTFLSSYIFHVGDSYTRCFDVIQCTDNNFVAVGSKSAQGTTYPDFRIHKFDGGANTLWSYSYIAESATAGTEVVQRPDGGYIAVGTVLEETTNALYCIINPDGTSETLISIGDTAGTDVATSVTKAQTGGYVFAGYTNSTGMGSYDFWLRKLNDAGTTVWGHTYGGTAVERAEDVILTSDGGFALTGSTLSFGAGSSDIWLVKTDSLGNAQWSWVFGGTGSETGYSIVQTIDGCYYIAGSTSSWGSPDEGILVKFSADGTACLGYNIGFGGDHMQTGTDDGTFQAVRIENIQDSPDLMIGKSIRTTCVRQKETSRKVETQSRALVTPTVTTICN